MPIGQLAHIGLGKETAWGTPVAASDYLEFVSESITHEIEQLELESIKSILDELPSIPGLETFQGDIAFDVRPQSVGYILHSLLGTPVTTGTSPYDHVFTPRSSQFSSDCFLQPYTFEIFRDTTNAFQYAGAVVNQLQLQFGVDQKILRAVASIIAKDVALIAETTPSFESADPFTWDEAVIKFAADVSGLTGASANNNLESFNMTINNNCEGIPLLNNTRKIGKIKPTGRRSIELGFTIEADEDEYNNFKNQTYQAMQIEFTSGTDKLKIVLPKVKQVSHPLGVGGAGRITVEVGGRAFYDATEQKSVEITLTNSKSSY